MMKTLVEENAAVRREKLVGVKTDGGDVRGRE